MKEEWRGIENFPNYEVSNTGRVKNILTHKELKHSMYSSGLNIVCLSFKGKAKSISVARLVLSAFRPCENMDNLNIRYIDGNKNNIQLDNLEWSSQRYMGKFAILPNELKELKYLLNQENERVIQEWFAKYKEEHEYETID